METKIREYIKKWKKQGYPIDIPDNVPNELMKLQIAPSYKAIALAILKNDHSMKTLGFDNKKSEWYSFFKRIEIEARNRNKIDIQLELF